MAEIIDDSNHPMEGDFPGGKKLEFITPEVAAAADDAKKSADQFFSATKSHLNVPTVKQFHDAIESSLSAVYPAEVGAPTGPYVEGLLKAKQGLEEFQHSFSVVTEELKEEDKAAISQAAQIYQGYSIRFMMVSFYFEEGLNIGVEEGGEQGGEEE